MQRKGKSDIIGALAGLRLARMELELMRAHFYQLEADTEMPRSIMSLGVPRLTAGLAAMTALIAVTIWLMQTWFVERIVLSAAMAVIAVTLGYAETSAVSAKRRAEMFRSRLRAQLESSGELLREIREHEGRMAAAIGIRSDD